MKRILDVKDGVTETFHYDDATGKSTIETTVDVEPLMDANKRQFNDAPKRHESEAFNKVASIPVVAAQMWCKERGVNYGEFLANPDHLKAFLNDRDNSVWRTRPGKI